VGVLDDGEGALFDSGLLVDCQSTVVVVGVVVVVGGRVRVVVVVVVRRRRRGRARVVVVVRAVGSDGGYGRDGLVVVVVAVAVAAKGGEGTEAFTERSVVVMVVAVLVDLYVNLEVVVVGRTGGWEVRYIYTRAQGDAWVVDCVRLSGCLWCVV
jgi:hypothetical protein